MPLVELGIDGGLSYKEPWGFSVKSSRKHGGKFLNLKGSVQRLRTMMSWRSGFQIPTGDGAGNCWPPMCISHTSPRSWLPRCIPTRIPATTLVSLLLSFPWAWSACVHSSREFSSLGAALDHNPTLLGAASEAQFPTTAPSLDPAGTWGRGPEDTLDAISFFPSSLHFPPVFPGII